MRVSIWKFPLPIVDYPQIMMPKYAKILSVQVQNNVPCIRIGRELAERTGIPFLEDYGSLYGQRVHISEHVLGADTTPTRSKR